MAKVRVERVLSNMGYGSRKEVKLLVKKGKVKVNSETVKNGSFLVDLEKDIIEFDNIVVEYKEFIYIMLNKPAGFVSATKDNLHETIVDLLDEEDRIFEPFPVGRLDIDTEGLLLLTNDGKFSHDLLSPKKHIPKKYYVELDGPISESIVEKFRDGINVNDEYTTMPAKLEILCEKGKNAAYVTIMEGKYHQIKRMFLEELLEVTYLKRLMMGELELDINLELGQYRELDLAEVELLKNSKRGIDL
ncbi:MAG: 16S rRNA pseudouridine(516) synthase [Acidaminobacteraceae bacterium]